MEYLFKKIGLTEYEIKAYLALLRSEPTTAYKLGKLSGIPSGRIYDVCDNLVSKGMIAILSGKPRRFQGINPKKAIAALLAKKEQEWKKTQNQIKNIMNKLEKKKIDEEPVSLSKGKALFHYSTFDMIKSAKKELLSIANDLTGVKMGIIDIATVTKMIVKKGVVHKVIVPPTMKNKKIAKKIAKIGVQIRTYPIKGLRITLIDNKKCLLSVADESLPYKKLMIKIESPVFCRGMKTLFDVLWKKSKKLV